MLHQHIILSEHDHPVVEKDDPDSIDFDPEDGLYATIKLSETMTIAGPAKVIFGWIDELHARSQLAR